MISDILSEANDIIVSTSLVCENYLDEMEETGLYEEGVANITAAIKKSVAALITKLKNLFRSSAEKAQEASIKKKKEAALKKLKKLPADAKVEMCDFKAMMQTAQKSEKYTTKIINQLEKDLKRAFSHSNDGQSLLFNAMDDAQKRYEDFEREMEKAKNRKVKVTAFEAIHIIEIDPDEFVKKFSDNVFDALDKLESAYEQVAPDWISDETKAEARSTKGFIGNQVMTDRESGRRNPAIKRTTSGTVKRYIERSSNAFFNCCARHHKISNAILTGTSVLYSLGAIDDTIKAVTKRSPLRAASAVFNAYTANTSEQMRKEVKRLAKDRFNESDESYYTAIDKKYILNESTEMEEYDTMENIYMEGANIDLQKTCHAAKKVFNKEMRDMKRNIKSMDFKGASENAKAAEEAIKTVKNALKKYPAGDLTANLLGAVIGFGKITVKSLAWSLVPLFGNVKAVMDGFRLSDAAFTTKWKSIKNRQEGKQDHTVYNTLYVDCVKWLESMERKLAKVSQKLKTMKGLDAIAKESVMDHMVAEEDEKYLLAQFESVDPEMLDLMYCEGFLDTEDYIELYKEATEEEYVDDIFDESANEFDFDFENEYDESYTDYEDDDDYYEGYEDDEDYDFDDFDL